MNTPDKEQEFALRRAYLAEFKLLLSEEAYREAWLKLLRDEADYLFKAHVTHPEE